MKGSRICQPQIWFFGVRIILCKFYLPYTFFSDIPVNCLSPFEAPEPYHFPYFRTVYKLQLPFETYILVDLIEKNVL